MLEENVKDFYAQQQQRNTALLRESTYLKDRVDSQVLPLSVDLVGEKTLDAEKLQVIAALEKKAAAVALGSLASLAKINELDHLGGGLELIPSLLMTLLACDNQPQRQYTIEHAHTSIGYYSSLAVLGYLNEQDVIDQFRRSLDIAGHVSWVPGGTQLNGGRLGVMVPVAVGQSLGMKAHFGDEALVICHCGDAGWVSGQALDGFLGASAHGAPIVFVMHRNGIQLSNTTQGILDKDPRKIIGALGVEILEISSLHNTADLYAAYREAAALARGGKATLIYPAGFTGVTLAEFGEKYGVAVELKAFAAEHGVALDTQVWVPGSLMSWRDVGPMFECLFFVNNLPGGHGHHDGHMKGRDLNEVLANPLMQLTDEETAALEKLSSQPKASRVTSARPSPGTKNLVLSKGQLDEVELPPAGKKVSPRAGSQVGYAAVAKAFPDRFFTVSCDLDPSTKLDKAKTFIDERHKFEMGITEQASSLMADGLACSSTDPQLVVFATFGAFFEGIAREGLEVWRYQRNLNGINEGLNVTMHLSHVGGITGRDHFSGWSLDWINLAIGYLPYLHRFYTPADARAAFLAVKDMAAHYGGHIIGIPRDNVPVLDKQDGSGALWEADSDWTPTTLYRSSDAKKAIIAVGCTAFLGGETFDKLAADGVGVDVIVVNGMPIAQKTIDQWLSRYAEGIVTIEDGIIGEPASGLRGFAGLLQNAAYGSSIPLAHVGITDPRIAPSDGFVEVWEHFGITTQSLVAAVKSF